MPNASPFERLPNRSRAQVTVFVEDEPVEVCAHDSAAAAVLAAGLLPSRTTPADASPRAPYCLMGVCFECLIEIDGAPNQQGCMIPVRDGMRIRRQCGARDMHGEGAHDHA
ncbi:(2Fe-2S)-binding protein [Halomonas beimenensis]|uniref:Opine oxidase subunit C n=1 Tax=Halomonas beimenensis TaxID=475662 RepID=A0A291PBX2_9GAMM|nr:(2Fe-2S)-binding protein [Halomonas beimenensis]ATJ84341.1 opine oxidase subunit C [Halomonas beimenensis]